MYKLYKPILALLLGVATISWAKSSLHIGDHAPAFTLYGDDGKQHSLSDYRGKKVIILFYPRDNSPFCTQEACSMRDNFEVFTKHKIVVLGISCDSVATHQKFKKQYNLPFLLLSDPKSKIFSRYEAKGMLINSRITYIIDESGVINKIFSSVKPTTHAQDLATYLRIK